MKAKISVSFLITLTLIAFSLFFCFWWGIKLRHSLRENDNLRQRLEHYANLSIAPTKNNIDRGKAHLEQLKKEEEKIGSETLARSPTLNETPSLPDLEEFTEKWNNRFKDQGIRIPKECGLCFSNDLDASSYPSDVNSVSNQLSVLDTLLNKLLLAKPTTLITIKGDIPGEEKQKTHSKNYFFVHFSGKIASLKAFVNQLESVSFPAVIKKVEFKPLNTTEEEGLLEFKLDIEYLKTEKVTS